MFLAVMAMMMKCVGFFSQWSEVQGDRANPGVGAGFPVYVQLSTDSM